MGRISRYSGNNFFLVTTVDADKNKEKTRDGKTVLKIPNKNKLFSIRQSWALLPAA